MWSDFTKKNRLLGSEESFVLESDYRLLVALYDIDSVKKQLMRIIR